MATFNTNSLHNPKAAQWLLRLGLAFVFVYAGVGMLRQPGAWAGYLPHFLAGSTYATRFLELMGVFQLSLAAWLVWGKYLRYAALIAFGLLGGIVFFNLNSLDITFRDVGLAAAALALVFAV